MGRKILGYTLTVIILKKTLWDAHESSLLERNSNIIWKHTIGRRGLVTSYTVLGLSG